MKNKKYKQEKQESELFSNVAFVGTPLLQPLYQVQLSDNVEEETEQTEKQLDFHTIVDDPK